jgi:hypothetical protein
MELKLVREIFTDNSTIGNYITAMYSFVILLKI